MDLHRQKNIKPLTSGHYKNQHKHSCWWRWTNTCGDGDTLASVAGAIFMVGCHKRCVLFLTVEPREAAVIGGSVASVHVSVLTRCSDNAVGFSNRRRPPGHERTAVFTRCLHNHICRRAWLCEERKTVEDGDIIMKFVVFVPVKWLNLKVYDNIVFIFEHNFIKTMQTSIYSYLTLLACNYLLIIYWLASCIL